MDGIVHPYYTVALAPAIAALVGISLRELWRGRKFLAPRIVLATMSAATGVWSFILLERTPEWWPALRWIALAGSIVAAAMLVVGADRLGRRGTAVLASGAILFGILAPAAYTVVTVANAHNGPIVMAGPDHSLSGMGGPGGGMGGPGGGMGGPGEGMGGHGPGGAAADNPVLEHLVTGLHNRWAAATVGSFTASGLELKTGASVMAIGGFSGSDNSPTLTQFQAYVADHQVRYFIASERDGEGEGMRHRESGSASEISTWVRQNFTPIDVAGASVYDLDAPIGG